jgi:hypothetical protein
MTLRMQQLLASLCLPVVVLAGALLHGPVGRTYAQDESSIRSAKLVPIDADFYYGSFRLKEQWDRMTAGPVVRELMDQPVIEKVLALFRSEWREREGIGGQARVFLDNGNVTDVLAFLQELVSKDVFVFGDKNMSKWYDSLAKINEELPPLLMSSDSSSGEQVQIIAGKWIEAMKGKEIPTFVFGARCDNADIGLGKIDQLEVPIFALKQFPEAAPFAQNLKRIEDSRGDRMQWVLNGSQIPWDSIPTNDVFDEEMRDQLKGALNDKSITISIGLFDGHFIFGVSSTPEKLLALGQGKSILEHPEMQPARDLISRSLISLSYVSDAFAKANFNATYNNFFSRNAFSSGYQALQLLEEDSEFRDFFVDLLGDLKWMDESIAEVVPEFKGATSVGFLTEDGWERHDHLRTQDVLLDSNSPLTALEHVGGDPMMMVASRLQDHPEYFQLARKIVQRAKARFDEAMELDWSELDIELDNDQVRENADAVWPFVVRIADSWEKKFLPSMSGEHAVVLSGGNLAAQQWYKDMPSSADPLPFPELAMVTGLKNQELFKSGMEDLLSICDDIVEMIRKEDSAAIPPDYKIPRPVKSKSETGEKFGYPIPADCPVPEEMMPQALFSGDYVFGNYSDKQSASLSSVKKLSVGKGVIDPNARQSNASYIHVGRLFDFARPWVRYALMDKLDMSLFEETLPDEYEQYDITGKEVLSIYSVLGKIGDFSSFSVRKPTGETFIRSVYRVNKSE